MGIMNKLRKGREGLIDSVDWMLCGGRRVYRGADKPKQRQAILDRFKALLRAIEEYGAQIGAMEEHFPGEGEEWRKRLDLTLREVAEKYGYMISVIKILD